MERERERVGPNERLLKNPSLFFRRRIDPNARWPVELIIKMFSFHPQNKLMFMTEADWMLRSRAEPGPLKLLLLFQKLKFFSGLSRALLVFTHARQSMLLDGLAWLTWLHYIISHLTHSLAQLDSTRLGSTSAWFLLNFIIFI